MLGLKENMHGLDIFYRTRRGDNRDLNEDNLMVSKSDDLVILAVADGLGGHAAGEIASRLAVHEFAESLKLKASHPELKVAVRIAICKANKAIYALSKENENYRGMASTLVAAIVSPEEALVANVGDSRAYLVGSNVLKITKDHSLVKQMVDSGLISEEESLSHTQKNIITMSLGRKIEIQPNFFPLVLAGKTLLLCSDGLCDSLRDEEIGNIIVGSHNLEAACNGLIKAAECRGALDDITIVLAREAINNSRI
jgi:serine/threonine protein phosphatase PrpC